jgi:hypothetical protein
VSTTPPHNLDAELSVLGAVLNYPDLLDQIVLVPDDFYRPVHRELWSVLVKLGPTRITAEAVAAAMSGNGTSVKSLITKATANGAMRSTVHTNVDLLVEATTKRDLQRRGFDLLAGIAARQPAAQVLADFHHGLEDLQYRPEERRRAPCLQFHDVADLATEVDAAGEPRYLLRPVWAEDDYGVLGAVDKAGKSWMAADAAVSIASATRWLGIFDVDAPGPVLLFVGEGGRRKIVRRMRAICSERGLKLEQLAHPVRVCLRVPHLTDAVAMSAMEQEIAATRPALVIIDPLYLAARGARGSDLYDMGAHLEEAQAIAQRHGAALMVVTHWNQTGKGTGAIRFSGAGPSAWGRVLISAAVVSRHTDSSTKRTSVVLDLVIQGDEVPDQTVRIRREVWSEDPDDLTAVLHYEVTPVETGAARDPRTSGLRPSAGRVLHVLERDGSQLTVRQIGDLLAVDGQGPPLKARTIQEALGELADADLVDATAHQQGAARYWWVLVEATEPDA